MLPVKISNIASVATCRNSSPYAHDAEFQHVAKPRRIWLGIMALPVLLVTLILICGASLGFAEPVESAYSITGIKAYLYLSHKDALSKDISDEPKGSLWNTVIGGGIAGSPSESTIVVVEVSGAPGQYQTKRNIEVLVTEIGKKVVTKLKRKSPIGVLSKDGKFYAIFLVYEAGCLPLEISARVLGQPDRTLKNKRINFECGE